MIRLTCPCGKSLKASDKLAGKESRCPACGAAVVVAPLAEVREPLEDDSPEYALAPMPTSTFVPRAIAGVDPNYIRTSVYKRSAIEKFCDPLVGVKFLFRISGILAVLTGLGVALYPAVLHEGFSWMSGVLLACAWIAITALAIGYGCQFLDAVLEHAVGGGEKNLQIPDYDPGPVFTTLVRWGLCFVSGPAFLFYFAFCYWIRCGDMTLLDGLILAELTVPAVGFWMLGLLVLTKRPDLPGLSPVQVIKVARRIGYRSLLLALAVTAGGFAHVWLGAGAITLLFTSWMAGLFLLWICWFSAWQSAAFALRTLGFWDHNRVKSISQPPSRPAIAAPS